MGKNNAYDELLEKKRQLYEIVGAEHAYTLFESLVKSERVKAKEEMLSEILETVRSVVRTFDLRLFDVATEIQVRVLLEDGQINLIKCKTEKRRLKNAQDSREEETLQEVSTPSQNGQAEDSDGVSAEFPT